MKTNSCLSVASSPLAAALPGDLPVSDSQYSGLVSKRMMSADASSSEEQREKDVRGERWVLRS
jgi:hypothetical protein